MSTRNVTTCNLCGHECITGSAVQFLADIDVCEICSERPIRDLAPLFADLTGQARLDIPLSQREQAVLSRLAEGQSLPEVALGLYVSVSTAKDIAGSVYRKLGASGRAQAMVAAARSGLI